MVGTHWTHIALVISGFGLACEVEVALNCTPALPQVVYMTACAKGRPPVSRGRGREVLGAADRYTLLVLAPSARGVTVVSGSAKTTAHTLGPGFAEGQDTLTLEE